MSEENPNLHFLITKQLKRANLNENDVSPNKRNEWRNFLSRVSATYFDQEQERYLNERSLEISSREMRELNEKLEMDITEIKLAEENLKKMHQQLLSISRQAGMAEVATSVLHNIGNILNSAKVSIALLLEKISKSHLDKLIKIAEMVKEHIVKKDDYLTNDENGKLVPDYLIALSKDILEEQSNIYDEIHNVKIHLNHIKDIVLLQKDISGVAGIKEKIHLPEIVDLAIQMGCSSNDSKEIKILKNYQYNGDFLTEKAKLLQILVNLVRNARDSVTAFQKIPKEINITIKKIDKKSSVVIIIQDNGVGISNENLTHIFSLGFTTKPEGHGFGLHSSAIAATELGGALSVESRGIGKGAIFIIELPLLTENIKSKEVIS